MAALLIDEGVEALSESRESFPLGKAANLVEKVSSEIADEGKRANFQRAMLEAIKTLR